MNHKTILHRHNNGSVLIGACIASGVIFIMIMGMLLFITNEYKLNVRSHKWTQSLNLAEAGVDIAFAEFNNYYLTGSNAFTSSRGWSDAGGGAYYYYNYSFTNSFSENVGIVYSYVYGVGTANPYLFAYGGSSIVSNNQWVYRAVESRLKNSAQFPVGMLAKGVIDMKGNGVTTDSYDSSDTTKSTGGRYDATKKQANGDIATNDAFINSDISVQNANIYGRALTGSSGTVTLGASGTIGPTFVNPATSVAAASANGWVRNDFAVTVPDVSLPSGASSWSSVGSLDTETLSTGDYKASDISPKSGETLTITGNVRIYVTGATDIKGQITVSSNATLTIYSAGNMSIGGNGVANNSSSSKNCIFYGLSTCTSISLQGNANWCGLVYAPQAALGIGGGGSSGDFSGSVVAKSIGMNGHVTFHYDEMLRKSGPSASYDIASWKAYRWTGSSWVSE